jgi:hypothetical protein
MTAGFSLSSDPQMFATAVTSSLSSAIPADFSSVTVSALILGNVPGMSGVQNFTIPEPVPSAPTSPVQNFSIPEPAKSALALTTANDGLSSGQIAVIAMCGIAVILIGGLVWWKLKRSSMATVWPEEKKMKNLINTPFYSLPFIKDD